MVTELRAALKEIRACVWAGRAHVRAMPPSRNALEVDRRHRLQLRLTRIEEQVDHLEHLCARQEREELAPTLAASVQEKLCR